MTDEELDALRRLRPDDVLSDEAVDAAVLARQRGEFAAMIEPSRAGEGFEPPSIYPRLAYEDERAALEYLTRVFGFTELREARMEHPTGTLAWLRLGTGVVMIGRAGEELHRLFSPGQIGATTTMINVYVADVDAHYEHALAQGATIVMELEDMFWGDRRYEALDLEGHRWHFAQRHTSTTNDR
jgi:PhnB protein